MKTQLHNYDVYPKVFLAGELVMVTVKPWVSIKTRVEKAEAE